MAKRATSRKGRKAAAKPAGRVVKKAGGEIASALAKLDEEKAVALAKIEEQRKELLMKAMETKREAVAKAKEAAAAAQKALQKAEKDLHDALVEAGLARGGRKGAGKSGRKPRVTLDTKKAAVAEALKGSESGIAFSDLRAKLLAVTDPASGGPVFASTDFNSASKFGPRFLPRGWKVKGERKNAVVVKGR